MKSLESHQETRGSHRSLVFVAGLVGAALLALPAAPRAFDATPRLIANPIETQPFLPTMILDCLDYHVDVQKSGATSYVTVTIQNTCYQKADIDAGVELLIQVVGTTHALVVDQGHLKGKVPVVLHGSFTNGIVAQEPCIKLDGFWKLVDGSQPPRSISDRRCFFTQESR